MDFTELIDLASEKLGGSVLYANDDFFAPKENLIKPSAPIWIEGRYTDDGKWMDGWESRRRRSPRLDEKFDWCIIRLGMPGEVKGVVQGAGDGRALGDRGEVEHGQQDGAGGGHGRTPNGRGGWPEDGSATELVEGVPTP